MAQGTALASAVRVVALHVHHGLQAPADDWEHFCATLCREAQVPLVTERVTVQALAGEGIEAAARQARYAALGRMCRAHGAALLLFAHHRDDQVETVLMRLFRGAGVAGMAGMPARRPLDAQGDVQLLRPWLDVSRDEIDAYCAAHGLSWIEDPSMPIPASSAMPCAHNCRRCARPSALVENVLQAASHFGQAAAMLDGLAAGEPGPSRLAGARRGHPC